MTEQLCLKDGYRRSSDALVIYADGKEVVLDRTVLYPQGGGQPSDTGTLRRADGVFTVLAVRKKDGQVVHVVDKEGIAVGDAVVVEVDWERRYRIMRMHTAAHVLSAVAYTETGLLITGNALGTEKSHLDFNLEQCDKAVMRSIVDKANALIKQGAPISVSFLPREEAFKIPSIVKLASILPPSVPILRIVTIGDIDKQADGGTHVKDIKEVGMISLLSVDNKGKSNRRMYFTLA